MASFPIPTVGWADVRVTDARRQAVTRSKFTGKPKVYAHQSPERYRLKLKTKPFKEGDANATAWIAFFNSLDGMVNTLTMDISRYVQGRSGLTNVTFRLVKPDTGPFGFGKPRVFYFELEALSE